MQETWVWSLGWEDPLERGMATHSSVLAWRIPWTQEPGGLQSTGSHRLGHGWAPFTFLVGWGLRTQHRVPGAGALPLAKVMRKEAGHMQRRDWASGVPLEILEHLPSKISVCLLSALCSHLHLWLYGGLSPTTSLWKKELTYSSS